MKLQTLRITGGDSNTFLQGLLTCDTNELDSAGLLAACCNQKGRIIVNFWISHDENSFYLTLPKLLIDTLQNHLQKYVFRSKVTFEQREVSDMPPEKTLWILPETSELFTPQMIDLEKHGGVSFNKGCYLGQEIIARTQHLGQLKRHLYQISFDDMSAAKVGDDVTNSAGDKLGTLVATYEDSAFAVIEDRAIDEALFVNSSEIKTINRP